MSQDYTKLKNVDLVALLKERNLDTTGKKADLVARLQENDNEEAVSAPAGAAAKPTTAATTTEEDEIDWDDDAITAPAAATSEPAAAAIAAGGSGERAQNPRDVPNQIPAKEPGVEPTAPAQTTAGNAEAVETAAKAGDKDAAPKPAAVYSSQLPPTSLDAELAKRKARAAKFGVKETDGDAVKALERAKRFGTGQSGEAAAGEVAAAGAAKGVRGLDEALPERAKKRGRAAIEGDVAEKRGDAFEDEGLIKRPRRDGGRDRGRGRRGRRGGRDAGAREARPAREKTEGGAKSWMSEADKQKAEARKARWAVPAS